MLLKAKYLIIILIFIGWSEFAVGQDLGEYIAREQSFRKTGMLVLGSWAAANIVGGMVMRANTSGPNRYFHEMNAAWNVVNLGIAAGVYYGGANIDPGLSGYELLKEQQYFDRFFFLNMGLDLAYISFGAWMTERSKNVSEHNERWLGYGRSVMLQGAFLFVFDVVNVWLHRSIALPESLLLSLNLGSEAPLNLVWRL